jgi:hypothetical protein
VTHRNESQPRVASLMRSALTLSCWLSLVPLARAQDVQSWNEVDVAASWQNVEIIMPLLARTDTHLPNPQLAATGITADVHLPWQLTLISGYLSADLLQRSDLVHVPLFVVSKAFHASRLIVTDRNRFEKLIGFGASPIRYRSRWHVFADNKVFLHLSASQWNQNRFRNGGGAQLNRHLSLDVYYLQRNPSAGALETRVVGTTLKIQLTPRAAREEPSISCNAVSRHGFR